MPSQECFMNLILQNTYAKNAQIQDNIQVFKVNVLIV